VPCSGEYKVELWGAQGTSYDNTYRGGFGGYTSGKINFKMNKQYYVYVGEHKSDKSIETVFNGGGRGKNANDQNGFQIGYSGGGATDIRLINGNWEEFTSLKSRIIVAGAGGATGAVYQPNTILYPDVEIDFFGDAGDAGGLEGGEGINVYKYNFFGNIFASTGGTQISGGHVNETEGNFFVNNGGFGYGGYNNYHSVGGAGGGAGYYGGGASSRGHAGSGGGSSFISGHDGCDAISEQSTEDNIIHTNQSIHYSGLYFTDTVMIDGAGYKWTDHKLEDLGMVGMPTHSGIGTMTGNAGDGFAKITLLTRKPN